MTDPNPDPVRAFLTSEWTESRGIVDKMDAQLSGLRQFGFSFITVLLAGTSILYQASTANGGIFTPTVKLAVILATFGLIEALYATDCFYRLIQGSAAHKAKMLESVLGDNDGLTGVIGVTYRATKAWYFIEGLYCVFLVAAAGLGLAVLPLWSWQWDAIPLILVAALAAVGLLDRQATKVTLEQKRVFPMQGQKAA